jgi:hypothetical protein
MCRVVGRAPGDVLLTRMAHESLTELLGSHKVRIARALARQLRALSPNYATLEITALEANFARLIGLIAHFLQSGDDTSLKNFGTHTAQLRHALGFSTRDFVAATLVFLPVIRQFLVEHHQDAARGLRDYEAFEAVAIPMIAEMGAVFRQVSTEFSDDDDVEVTTPSGRTAARQRFRIESVVGGPEVELSPFHEVD